MCVWGRECVCECVCEGERDLRCLDFLGTKTSSHSVEQLFSFFCTFTPPENAAACRVCYQTFIIFFIFCIFFTFSPAEKKELLLQIQHSAGGAIYSLFCLFLLWSKSRSRGRNTYKPENIFDMCQNEDTESVQLSESDCWYYPILLQSNYSSTVGNTQSCCC